MLLELYVFILSLRTLKKFFYLFLSLQLLLLLSSACLIYFCTVIYGRALYLYGYFERLNEALNFDVANLLLVICFVILIIITISHFVNKKNKKKEDEYLTLYADPNFKNNEDLDKIVKFLSRRHLLRALLQQQEEERAKQEALEEKLRSKINAQISKDYHSLFEEFNKKIDLKEKELQKAQESRKTADEIKTKLEQDRKDLLNKKDEYEKNTTNANKAKQDADEARIDYEKKKKSLDSEYEKKAQKLVNEYQQKEKELDDQRQAFESERDNYKTAIDNYLAMKETIENEQERDMEPFDTDLEFIKENPDKKISRDEYLSFNCNAY